jgi:hypothetical protein
VLADRGNARRPYEPNIAVPRIWLDFEHAGRNTLAGEVANLLWYLIGMGGWLVPTYQPDVYQRTLRHHVPPVTTPHAKHLDISTEHRRIEVTTRWSIGIGRFAALDALLAALHGDLGTACATGRSSVIDALRPFLVCRILGVINLRVLDGTDAVLCLAKLAELCQPDLTLRDLLSSVTTSALAAEPERHFVLAEPRQPDAPVASSPSSQYSTHSTRCGAEPACRSKRGEHS